ncbi:MAG TPA: histidinol dehydrogenase [Leptospiraceae bacterium]|nr:histidinol dehydrogenase [Leptospiraceae bacterium]
MNISIRKTSLGDDVCRGILNRAKEDLSSARDAVWPILEDVRKNGDSAVRKYTEKFDGIVLSSFAVKPSEVKTEISSAEKKAFEKAKENIWNFHELQKPVNREKTVDGNRLGIRYTPIERLAVYAPGGTALYPSSVLMGVIPAKIAGVREVNLFTPPSKNGLHPSLVFVAEMLGVDNIFTVGGAQAVAAAGYGTESIPKADFIVGPGNKYVAAAKGVLAGLGQIGIESIAGPSEVFIIADETANPEWIACDMLSQAEHGEDSVAVLATTSAELAERVKSELSRAAVQRPKRLEMKRKAIENNSHILIFPSMEQCIDFSNQYAPEHLEIQTKDYNSVFEKILHAGSVFLGPYSPVAVGDYISGTNHILPTAGLARISSSLGVDSFLKRVTYQEVTKDSLMNLYPHVDLMSRIEGLDEEHGTSVKLRTLE